MPTLIVILVLADPRDGLFFLLTWRKLELRLTKWAQLAGKPWCEWFFTSPRRAVGWLSKVASAEIRKRRRRRVWSAALYLHEASLRRQANLTSLEAARCSHAHMHACVCILPHRRHNEGRVRCICGLDLTTHSFKPLDVTWGGSGRELITLPSSAKWPHFISSFYILQ